MTDMVLSKKVEAVFTEMLNGRVSAPSAERSKEMIAKRVALLSLYTQPGVASELRDQFSEAIKFTEACHGTANTFLALGEQISSLSNTSGADLLLSARVWLDSARLQGAETPFDDEFTKVRDDVLRVLVAAAKDPSRSQELVRDIVSKDLADLSPDHMSMSMHEAAMLYMAVNNWRRAFETLALCAQVGLICRGMLYSGLIDALGSRLERQASWEKVEESLADIPGEAVSMVPGIGDVFGPAKLIFELITDLINKERALRDEVADHISSQARARQFGELYRASLQTWAVWALALQKPIVDMLLSTSKQLAGTRDAASPGDDTATA